MNNLQPVYTEKNNCQDCYKCLRNCPVKAIKIEKGSASVIHEQCIYCGHCVQVCPVDAKKVRDDLPGLHEMFQNSNRVFVSLAPSWVSEFPGMTASQMVNILVGLGFEGVSETALGAEIVSRQTSEWLKSQDGGAFISSCCPSVVQMVCRHYPRLKDRLVPVLSPMQAHGQFLRDTYGNDIKIVFFGPCIAKKTETGPSYVDLALTFKDLRLLIESINPAREIRSSTPDMSFVPFNVGKGNFFPVDGGMIANLKTNAQVTDLSYMSFSGTSQIKEILGHFDQFSTTERTFLELLVCEGGCIKGPGTISKTSTAVKRQQILQHARLLEPTSIEVGIKETELVDFKHIDTPYDREITPGEIVAALHAAGKFTPADELNCSGCGYDTCRDFAAAMVEGKAERMMCVSYTRQVAQGKASILLKKIPYGVVIVDENLKVIDSNRKFAEILGNGMPELYDDTNSLEKADIKNLLSFHKMFSTVLQTAEEMIERTVRYDNYLLDVSIVTIQPHKIVCGVIKNMNEPGVHAELVKKSVHEVIHQNMAVVQKIAFLLGENASFTESMLQRIVDSEDNSSLNN